MNERKKLGWKKCPIGDESSPVSPLSREHSTGQVLGAHRYLSPTNGSVKLSSLTTKSSLTLLAD